jgi:hypothetical protein
MKGIAAGGLGVLALVAAGCGAGSREPAAQAAHKTIEAGTARVAIAETLPGAAGRVTLRGAGIVDLEHSASDLTLDTGTVDPTSSTLEEVVDGGFIYLHTPGALPGDRWVKLTPAEMSQVSGTSSVVQSSSGLDPSQTLGLIADARPPAGWKTIGPGTVAGARTTHYRAVIDVARQLAKQSKLTQSQKKLAASAFRNARYDYDVWVDRNGLLRRLVVALGGSTPLGKVTISYTFSDVGGALAVHVPPPGRTIGLAQLTALGY